MLAAGAGNNARIIFVFLKFIKIILSCDLFINIPPPLPPISINLFLAFNSLRFFCALIISDLTVGSDLSLQIPLFR